MSGRFLKEPRISQVTKAVVLPSGLTSQRPEAPRFGSFRYNTETGRLEYYNGTVFQSVAVAEESPLTIDTYTGDNSTLTFTLSTTPSSAAQVLVFIGGVYQEATTHYTVTDDDITFDEAPPVGETVSVIQGVNASPQV